MKVIVKQVTDLDSENCGKYKVVEMVNSVRYDVGQYISKDEVWALSRTPATNVVVK
jgi:hypothetical protein